VPTAAPSVQPLTIAVNATSTNHICGRCQQSVLAITYLDSDRRPPVAQAHEAIRSDIAVARDRQTQRASTAAPCRCRLTLDDAADLGEPFVDDVVADDLAKQFGGRRVRELAELPQALHRASQLGNPLFGQ
jgi:hypothetical protein